MLGKAKTSSDFLQKIRSGVLSESLNELYELALKLKAKRGHSLEEVKTNLRVSKMQSVGISFTR